MCLRKRSDPHSLSSLRAKKPSVGGVKPFAAQIDDRTTTASLKHLDDNSNLHARNYKKEMEEKKSAVNPRFLTSPLHLAHSTLSFV